MFIQQRSFPELAHMFHLIISQFTQGVSILYNVKFLMPWRKLIARKPRRFEAKISALHETGCAVSLVFSDLHSRAGSL